MITHPDSSSMQITAKDLAKEVVREFLYEASEWQQHQLFSEVYDRLDHREKLEIHLQIQALKTKIEKTLLD